MARKAKAEIFKAAILSRSAMQRAATRDIRPVKSGLGSRPPRTPRPTDETKSVFLSYARRDRPFAKALAQYLQARGIKVWWDYKLFPGDKFRDRILAELKSATAVIVIWSDTAIASDFVLDEASRGKKMGKLITTHVPGFSSSDIPLGFGQSHVVCVTNRGQVLDALAEYGLIGDVAKTRPLDQSPLA